MTKENLFVLLMQKLCTLSNTKLAAYSTKDDYSLWVEDATGATFKITIEKVE